MKYSTLTKKQLPLMIAIAINTFPIVSNANTYDFLGDTEQLEKLKDSKYYLNEFEQDALGFGPGQGGDLSNNTININFTTSKDSNPEVVYGAMESSSDRLNLSNNTVNLKTGALGSNSNVVYKDASVYGVLAYTYGNNDIIANNNQINVTKDFGYFGSVMAAHVVATQFGSVTANNNKITLDSYNCNECFIAGVEAYAGRKNVTANDNEIIINNTTAQVMDVTGTDILSWGDGDLVSNRNKVVISGGKISNLELNTVYLYNEDIDEGEEEDEDYKNEIKELTGLDYTDLTNSKQNEFSGNSTIIENQADINVAKIATVNSSIPIYANISSNNLSVKNSTVSFASIYSVNVENQFKGNILNNEMIISDSNLSKTTLATVRVNDEYVSGNIDSNKLTIENSTLSSLSAPVISAVWADEASSVKFSKNSLIIGDNVVLDNQGEGVNLAAVYANDNATNTFSNNTVSISDKSNLSNANIYSVYLFDSSNNDTTSSMRDNTLAIHVAGKEGVALNSVNNFDNYRFYIDSQDALNTFVHTASEDAPLTRSNIKNYLLNTNERIVLNADSSIGFAINGNLNINTDDNNYTADIFNSVDATASIYGSEGGGEIQIQHGVGGIYTAEFKIDENGNTVIENVHQVRNTKSKALIEPQSVAMAFLNQGADLIADQNITPSQEHMWQGFVGFNGGTSRYNTGSHIRINGYSFVVGSAIQKEKITLGAFFEAGFANYHSHNNELDRKIYGSGDTNYKGVGLLARYDLMDDIYVDANLRVGRAKVDFESAALQVNGVNAAYDTHSTYFGASIGAGKVFVLNEASKIDLIGRYSYSYLQGKDVTTSTDNYDFDNTHSNRVKVDGVYTYQLNELVMPYVGLGYQYEFSGNSAGVISGMKAGETRLQGSTGSLQLGLAGNSDNITYNVAAKGYTGKREGVIGSFSVDYKF